MYSRLTTATMYGSLMNSLLQSQRQVQDLQQQIATGNKYTRLSDNPTEISRSLSIQSALNANEKYQANTKNAVTMLNHANSALNNVLDAAKSIRNLIIEAGDAALNSSQLADITQQIEANKKIMLDNLNTKIAGQYIFGGTDTSTVPFVEKSDGSIVYQGTDGRMKYALSESLLGDISFAGSDIVPEDEDSYFICSHYVPFDWQWTGREEKVQITVGNRTLSVFIPETWEDNDVNKTSTQTVNYTDDNGYRDPNELSGLSLDDLASIINSSLEEQGADMLVTAYIERDYNNKTQQLILKSNTGEKVGITGWPDTDYMPVPATIVSNDNLDEIIDDIGGEGSKLTVILDNSSTKSTEIEISEDDTVESIAQKLNNVEGVYARTSADGKSIVISAQRVGDKPTDNLRVDEAEEALHYPPITIKAEGNAMKLFTFSDDNIETDSSGNAVSGSISAKYTNRIKDQSHIDIFDYLGMETATKSREFDPEETLTVEEGTQLHWRISSGGRSVDVKLNSGDYSLEYIAERLQNAASGWLEVTIEPGGTDSNDDWGRYTADSEAQTQRLVMRGYNGEQVIFLDMNECNYADKLGISTALRTDAYDDKGTLDDTSDDYFGKGMKCVKFPSAPCVDDNIGIPLRVQMNCGMYYDINIKRADVVDSDTGFVNRTKVMQAIVNQVNEQEGHDIMGFVQHVDASGQDIEGSTAIYFLSGEAFTVVDMPFDDPEWGDYSGGIAVQMGIHGGVSSNLQKTHVKMTDSATFEEAYEDTASNPDYIENGTFRDGTIRFSNLAHTVDIDVSATDTVKDVLDRLRVQAGDWLYINYYDEHMGQLDAEGNRGGRNSGDYPLIAISSVDGSAVNILDIKGHIAEDALGISTGIQGRLNTDGTEEGIMDESKFVWNVEDEIFPADTISITVAGYTHTIDLTAIRDVTNDTLIKADDVAEFINARMQDEDVKALINSDNELVVYSPRGYSVEINFAQDGEDITNSFLGNISGFDVSSRTYYRGGYNLEGQAYSNDDSHARGINNDLYGSGIHTQNATIRSGANTMRQNGFGVLNDVVAAVKAGNREDLTEKMLPRVDNFIDNILKVMAEDGALRSRYDYNNERLVTENAIMTEQYDDLAKIDPADAISKLMVADYMYQANLAVIARLIQPSLLDFLG